MYVTYVDIDVFYSYLFCVQHVSGATCMVQHVMKYAATAQQESVISMVPVWMTHVAMAGNRMLATYVMMVSSMEKKVKGKR